MAKKAPRLEPYDLETIRLGHFSAVRQVNNGYGDFMGYSVVGQHSAWPKREASIAKLVAMGILEMDPAYFGAIECVMRLTVDGERLYKSFIAMEEDGSLAVMLEKLKKKKKC